MQNNVVLVTGAGQGIGRAIAAGWPAKVLTLSLTTCTKTIIPGKRSGKYRVPAVTDVSSPAMSAIRLYAVILSLKVSAGQGVLMY